jgi:hypothetical protein
MSADGNNYGLNGNYEYNEFEIDSFDALQAYNTTYTSLNWPRIYFGKPLTNVVAVKVLQVTVPFKYYVINSTNKNFLEYRIGPNTYHLKTLLEGSYTAAELATEIARAMSTTNTYICTYSLTTMKFTITLTVSGSAPATTSFKVVMSNISFVADTDGSITPRLAMGFNAGDSSSAVLGTGLVAPNIAQWNGPPYLYLNSATLGTMINLFLNGDGIVNANRTGADGPQVCMIPVNATRDNTITYNDPDPQKWFYVGSQNFNAGLDFYLTVGVGNQQVPLDLNGGRFCVKLGILQSKNQGNDNMPSTRHNNRVISRTWQAGGNMMQF